MNHRILAPMLATVCLGLAGGAHAVPSKASNPFGLGKAGKFAALNLSGKFQVSSGSKITGDAGAVDGSKIKLSKGTITGNVYLGDMVKDNIKKGIVQGGIVQTKASEKMLNAALASAKQASKTLAAMKASKANTFGVLDSTKTITGVSGLNVISVTGIDYSKGTLTFDGPADAEFVVNDTGIFKFDNSAPTAGGLVSPYNILFNITGGDASITGDKGGMADGIILDTNGEISLEDKTLTGALIGNEISVKSAGMVVGPAPVPEASTAISFGLMLVLGGVVLARKKASAV